MNGNGYLFAAYAITWVIHIAYLGTIVSRYSRLKREIEERIDISGQPSAVR